MDMRRRWLAFCRRAGAKPGTEAGAKPGTEAGAKPGTEAGAKPGTEAGAAGQAEDAFADLDRCYRESGRHYHTWAHVAACLGELRRARPPAEEALGLELAVWFHDAVYEPRRQDNEARSAELALRWASALALAPALGERAAELILATRYQQPGLPSGAAEALLRDIDLAVLGGCRGAYLRYERGIAREYSAMPPERYREGRAALLRGFLAQPALYATPAFRRRLERRALRNLARALVRLEKG